MSEAPASRARGYVQSTAPRASISGHWSRDRIGRLCWNVDGIRASDHKFIACGATLTTHCRNAVQNKPVFGLLVGPPTAHPPSCAHQLTQQPLSPLPKRLNKPGSPHNPAWCVAAVGPTAAPLLLMPLLGQPWTCLHSSPGGHFGPLDTPTHLLHLQQQAAKQPWPLTTSRQPPCPAAHPPNTNQPGPSPTRTPAPCVAAGAQGRHHAPLAPLTPELWCFQKLNMSKSASGVQLKNWCGGYGG